MRRPTSSLAPVQKDWQKYLPWLHSILADNQAAVDHLRALPELESPARQKQRQRLTQGLLFTLLPTSSFQPKHIPLDTRGVEVG